MAEVETTRVTLRIMGDDLDPEVVTRLLECQPDKSRRKGEIFHTPAANPITSRTGMWSLSASDPSLNINQQIESLLTALTENLENWKAVANSNVIELFCGVFLSEENQGMGIPPKTLRKLAERGVGLELDIYYEGK